MNQIKCDEFAKKIIFIMPRHSWNFQHIRKAGYVIIDPYRGKSIMLRILREIWFRANLPGKAIWYNKTVNSNADVLVVVDSLITREYMEWLWRHNRDSRLIVWYENSVKNTINPNSLPTQCEKWSSDPEDCREYGLRYEEGGGYFKFHVVKKKIVQYDVLYVGRDKGRSDTLFALKDIFEKQGLRTHFHITATRRYERFRKRYYKAPIPYEEILELISQSRAILHLTKGGQTGVTIRVMESLLNQIKLITDNTLLAEYAFYDKDNIFILGKDDINTLPEFLAKPYRPISEELLKHYYFDNFWNEKI